MTKPSESASSNEVSRSGIEIPEAVAEAAAIPEDLNANVFGPYAVPDPQRRKRAARVYVGGAAAVLASIFVGLPAGMWVLVVLLLALAAWHWQAGWPLEVREREALDAANRTTTFPVGHASANLGFHGLRSRPIWNVLVFSGDDPPTERALVRVDALTGSVVEHYAEAVPEAEWDQLAASS